MLSPPTFSRHVIRPIESCFFAPFIASLSVCLRALYWFLRTFEHSNFSSGDLTGPSKRQLDNVCPMAKKKQEFRKHFVVELVQLSQRGNETRWIMTLARMKYIRIEKYMKNQVDCFSRSYES